MHFLYSPYIIPLFIAALISGWMAVYAFTRRVTAAAIFLSVLAMAITEWLLCYAFEIAGADLPTKLIFGEMGYLGISIAPLMWFVFAYLHSNRDVKLSIRARILLSIIPNITFILAITNSYHGLIWSSVGIFQGVNFSALQVTHGLWFWVHSAYSYILLLAGTVYVLRSLGKMKGKFKWQTVALLVAVFSPWVGNILYLLDISPVPYLDLTPFAFTVTLVGLTWGILGFQLINLSPIARDFVVEHMEDGVVVCDTQDLITDINQSAQQIIGRPARALIGRNIEELLAGWPEILSRYHDADEDLGELLFGEQDPQWYELRLSLLIDRQKKKIGRIITVHNITERKKNEDKMRQLNQAVESSPSSIVITDIKGVIEYVNPKFTELTGYTFEEAIGQTPKIISTEFTPRETHTALWQNILAKKEWHGEFCNRKKDGSIYWEMASISPIIGAAGMIAHFVAIKEDITEQRLLQRQLLESETRYRQIVENASDLIYRVDTHGHFVYVNSPTLHMLGLPSEQDLLGKSLYELAKADSREAMAAFFTQQILERKTSTYYEYQTSTADGSTFWLGQNTQLILDEDEIVGLQAVARDITERKGAEEALALARDQAVEASQIKSQLLAKVSHELRTPLGAILGFAELLKYGTFGDLTTEQGEAAGQIIESVHFLNEMVNELLDEAQISAKRVVLKVESFSLFEVLERVQANMAVLAHRKKLEFALSTRPDMVNTIYGDEGRLQQILVNLAGNAIKFTNSGKVQIEIYRHDASHWGMMVSDTGIGIPEDALQYIFDPFRQVNSAIKHDNRGTGLGLTITKQLVELMGGKIMVESEVGRGSTFTVLLPLIENMEKMHGKTSRLDR
jgi:PAS domain S-box-containing protein